MYDDVAFLIHFLSGFKNPQHDDNNLLNLTAVVIDIQV